jgi:FMN phosphatase YigB (HAD superfamily)
LKKGRLYISQTVKKNQNTHYITGDLLMAVNFKSISTLLFDIDNTLLLFDERAFIPIYTKNIHTYFKTEIPDLNHFTKIFLESTHKMLQKEPLGVTNLTKFDIDFSKNFDKISPQEIRDRFLDFYQTKFDQLKQIMEPNPVALPLLKLASKYFTLVAATNPLFPAVANNIRLNWGGFGRGDIPWKEVSSADDYHFAKPHIEYYQELLNNIERKPSECMIIGNDPINDMVAGKIEIKTYLVTGINNKAKLIKTKLDYENPNFPVDYSGTLEDLYNSLNQYIKTKES